MGKKITPVGMSLTRAQNLTQGQYIYHIFNKDADGSASKARVTSVKLWKRSPDRVEVRYKRGLKEYGSFNEFDLKNYTDINKDA